MAGFADAHQVVCVPEQRGTATMPPLVVGNEQRRVVVEPAAALPLACEQITQQYRPPKVGPAFDLVPLAPRLKDSARLISGSLGINKRAERARNRRKARLDRGELERGNVVQANAE